MKEREKIEETKATYSWEEFIKEWLILWALILLMLAGAVAICAIVPAISYFFGVGMD